MFVVIMCPDHVTRFGVVGVVAGVVGFEDNDPRF